MYISKIDLNLRKHETAKAIYNANLFHGALERSFAGDRQHPLWRIEQNGCNTYMLVVSKDYPDFTSFVKQFGYADEPTQIKEYDTFLQTGFKTGDYLRFRAVVNPTIKVGGKRVPLNAKRTQKYSYSAADWIKEQLKKNGAQVIDVSLNAYEQKTVKSKKINYIQATFDGILQVKDAEQVANLLKNGIGHEKAYGCGLVSVMRM